MPVRVAASSPIGGECGVFVAGSRTPLTLTQCSVDAHVSGPAAEVRLEWTYLNETGKDAEVIVALPVQLNWTIVDAHTIYDGSEMQAQFEPNLTAVTEAPAAVPGSSSGTPDKAFAAATTYGGIAIAALPFTVAVGTHVTVGVAYLAPTRRTVDTLNHELAFLLPDTLVPPVRRPPAAVTNYQSVFTLLSQPKFDPQLRVKVSAHMHSPLRGEVQLATMTPMAATNDGGMGEGVGQWLPLENAVVAYHGDAAFTLMYTAPLPGTAQEEDDEMCDSASHYSGGPLLVRVGVQDTVEPLRVFVEKTSAAAAGTVNAEAQADGSAMVATLTPVDLEAKTGGLVNIEYVFVVGSHHPVTSTAVARAVRLAIRALPSTVHVNVIVIGSHSGGKDNDDEESRLVIFPRGSVPAAEVDLDQLAALVEELNPQPRQRRGAGLSSTLTALLPQRHRAVELLPALQGYVRHVVLLSDEACLPPATAPATVASLLRAIVSSTSCCRVSSVAITAQNTTEERHTPAGMALLQLIAREGGGLFMEACSPEQVPASLSCVLAATTVPTLVDVQLHIEATKTHGSGTDPNGHIRHAFSMHEPLPSIPSGSQLTIYALAGSSDPSVSVHATGRVGGQVVEFIGSGIGSNPADIAAREGSGVSPIARAAAAARVATLLADGARPTPEALHLSIAASVPCPPYTRLMLHRVDNAKMNNGAVTESFSKALSAVPVGGASAMDMATNAQLLAELETLRRRWAAILSSRLPGATGRNLSDHVSNGNSNMTTTIARGHRTVESFSPPVIAAGHGAATRSSPSQVERVLELQGRNGEWPLSADLAAAVGLDFATMEASEPVDETSTPRKQMNAHKKSLWATLVAVSYLEMQSEPVAALAVLTAMRQLQLQLAGNGDVRGEWRAQLGAARSLFDGSTGAP